MLEYSSSPTASAVVCWQWAFSSHLISTDPRSGLYRRHQRSASMLHKGIKVAGNLADLQYHVTPLMLRHSFATPMLEAGYDTQLLCSGQVSALCRPCWGISTVQPP